MFIFQGLDHVEKCGHIFGTHEPWTIPRIGLLLGILAIATLPMVAGANVEEVEGALSYLDHGEVQVAAEFLLDAIKKLPDNLNEPEKVVHLGQMLKFICDELMTERENLAFREKFIYPVKTERDQVLRFLFHTRSPKGMSLKEISEITQAYLWVMQGSDNAAKRACLGFAVGAYVDIGSPALAIEALNQFAALDEEGNITRELIASAGGKLQENPAGLRSFLSHQNWSPKMKGILLEDATSRLLFEYCESAERNGQRAGSEFLAQKIHLEEDWRCRYACVNMMRNDLGNETVYDSMHRIAARKELTADVIRARLLLINAALNERCLSEEMLGWAFDLGKNTRAVFPITERKIEPEIIHCLEHCAGLLTLQGNFDTAKELYNTLRDRYPGSNLASRMEQGLLRVDFLLKENAGR